MNWKCKTALILIALITVLPGVALAQDKPADNMQILRDKVKADKKLLIATNMELTETEAKGFWPIYEAYQKDLAAMHQRIGGLIESYAADYMAKTLTDEKAKKSHKNSNKKRHFTSEKPALFILIFPLMLQYSVIEPSNICLMLMNAIAYRRELLVYTLQVFHHFSQCVFMSSKNSPKFNGLL